MSACGCRPHARRHHAPDVAPDENWVDADNRHRSTWTPPRSSDGSSFQVRRGGVQGDDYLYDDTRNDGAWMRCGSRRAIDDGDGSRRSRPYSQLRFNAGENQAWGIKRRPTDPARNETSWLVLVPKDQRARCPGWRTSRHRGPRPGRPTSSCCPTSCPAATCPAR